MSIKSITKLLACSILVASTQGAQAADKNERYAIKGAGVSFCSTFAESIQARDKNYYIYGGWIEGYLTGLNQQLENTFDLAPWQTTELMLRMVEPICQQNPKQQFHTVVKAMAGQLSENKISEQGNYTQLEADKSLVFQESTVRLIKDTLVGRGFYDGDSDYKWGDGVISAMKKFQRSKGLKETGLPDQLSLYQLFYGTSEKTE